MAQLTPAKLRRHALILRERAPNYKRPEDEAMAFAQADKFEAEADLIDAQNNINSGIADDATIIREYPIIGKVKTEGGAIIEVEHPFSDTQIDALEKENIHIAFEWSFDPASGLDEGRLYRIYVGTTNDGPRAVWYNGRWRRLQSNKNFGKRYAFGGTWSSEKDTQPSLLQANADLASIIVRKIGDIPL